MTLTDCAKALRDILAPAGFSRESSTWRRDMGDFIDIIDFERDKLGSPTFAVGVGVLTKSAYEKAWGKKAPLRPRALNCTVNDDLANLSGEHELWRVMNDPDVMEKVKKQILRSAFPFLDEMHSRERQIRYLRERKYYREWIMPLYEAILMHECGQTDDACLKLKNHKSKYSRGLEERAAEIAARLNCPKL